MWKPKIYIGTSVFDSLIFDRQVVKDSSIALLQRCKEEVEYEGFISPYTIFELSNRYTEKELVYLIDLISKYDLKIIEYRLPGEIDLLVTWYNNAKILPAALYLDYYHLATCSYLNLEYYTCWNKNKIINFHTFRKLLHSHIPRGYRSNINLESPEYFIEQECSEGISDLIEHTFLSKKDCLKQLEKFAFGEKTKWVQFRSNELLKSRIKSILLPNEKIQPSRIPLLDLTDIQLKFDVKSFEDEIKENNIPLLDYNTAVFDMDYQMFQLKTSQGVQLLKNKQLEIIYNFPTQYSKEEFIQLTDERNANFINWLLPQIRNCIETPKETYAVIQPGQVRNYHYRDIDHKLADSISTESIKTVKLKALQLAELITKGSWQSFQGFQLSGEWCDLNSGFKHGNTTHIIIDKDGLEIWIVMMNAIIP